MSINRDDLANLELISNYLRRAAFQTILSAGSGHIGASSSSVELMTALYFGGILHYDVNNPRHPNRDRVLVRGHLGPLRYNLFALLGWVKADELCSYRSLGSRLQGHESMELLPGVDITPSGSLGMLLSYGVGAAYAFNAQEDISPKTYVFLGDGEEQEGNVSEAARHAASLGLNNLVCIIDKNGKQLSSPTNKADGKSNLKMIWQGYGWDVKEIFNGHSLSEIMHVFTQELSTTKPTLIIANTQKGYGVEGSLEHFSGYHTLSTCGPKKINSAIARLDALLVDAEIEEAVAEQLCKMNLLPPAKKAKKSDIVYLNASFYSKNFDDALEHILKQLVFAFEPPCGNRLYFLTADWSNQNQIEACCLDKPWVYYIDVGIREQHMMAMAHGIAVSDAHAKVVILDGDGFAFRGSDQLHALSQARTPITIIGTDSGICEARNGATHQSAAQPAMLTVMPSMLLLEPTNEADLLNCLNYSLNNQNGPVYIRLHSGACDESSLTSFRDFYIAYQPKVSTSLTIVTSGLIVKEAVNYAKVMEESGIGVAVVAVVAMQLLGSDFKEILDSTAAVLTIFNGNPTILQGHVTSALLQDGGWQTPVKSHGFSLGTTGSQADLEKHFNFDSAGISKVVSKLFPDIF